MLNPFRGREGDERRSPQRLPASIAEASAPTEALEAAVAAAGDGDLLLDLCDLCEAGMVELSYARLAERRGRDKDNLRKTILRWAEQGLLTVQPFAMPLAVIQLARARFARIVRLADLHASPFNPRKSFNPDEIEALADDIAARGLLQPITARPRPEGGYEIVAGERRYRALKALETAGRWSADRPVPTSVRVLGDVDARLVAIAENEKRSDVHPLEVAEGYLDLMEAMAAETGERLAAKLTDRIAKETGRSRRAIQFQIKLARELIGEGKEAFRAGRINQSIAQELATHDPQRQAAALALILAETPGWRTGADIAARLAQTGFPAREALFDPEDYTGPSHEEDGQLLLDDFTLVARLQRDAVAALAETRLTEGFAFAHVVETRTQFLGAYESAPDGAGGAGVVIYLCPETLATDERSGVFVRGARPAEPSPAPDAEPRPGEPAAAAIPPAAAADPWDEDPFDAIDREAEAEGATEAPARPVVRVEAPTRLASPAVPETARAYTPSQWSQARRVKIRALRAALARNERPNVIAATLVTAILAPDAWSTIAICEPIVDGARMSAVDLPAWLHVRAACRASPLLARALSDRGVVMRSEEPCELFDAVCDAGDPGVGEARPSAGAVLAALTADLVGAYVDATSAGPGDDELILAIVDALGLDDHELVGPVPALGREYFTAFTLDQLRALALDAGLDLAGAPEGKGRTLDWLLDHPDLPADWLPPELRFLRRDAAEEAVAMMLAKGADA